MANPLTVLREAVERSEDVLGNDTMTPLDEARPIELLPQLRRHPRPAQVAERKVTART